MSNGRTPLRVLSVLCIALSLAAMVASPAGAKATTRGSFSHTDRKVAVTLPPAVGRRAGLFAAADAQWANPKRPTSHEPFVAYLVMVDQPVVASSGEDLVVRVFRRRCVFVHGTPCGRNTAPSIKKSRFTYSPDLSAADLTIRFQNGTTGHIQWHVGTSFQQFFGLPAGWVYPGICDDGTPAGGAVVGRGNVASGVIFGHRFSTRRGIATLDYVAGAGC